MLEARKQKKIVKEGRRNGHKQAPEPQLGQQLKIRSAEQTPDQLRRQMARAVLSKIDKKPVQQDDFFIVDQEQNKRGEQQIAEQMKNQYLRKHFKFYEDISARFQDRQVGDPIDYKGHTLCITSFQVTPEHIYSCSKDKSIIKWDRQTKQKTFISLGKDINHHRSDILSLSLHANLNVLATGSDDCQIKLWDVRSNALIDTFRGHKNTVNGVKFGINSNNLCSVSADLTLKHWDFSQRGLIGTYYQHGAQILDLDCSNGDDFITSGYDRQVIAWKTQKQTKIVYKGHNYAIDRVRAINHERFVTACQDGSVYLWNTKKTKPTFKVNQAHGRGWISAMDNIKQSNIFATAGIDHVVKVWGIEGDNAGLRLLREIEVGGIVTDLKLTNDYVAVTECDELRLGRWVTEKCRNKIKIFPWSVGGQSLSS